ncbi:MAG: lytic transglycosylase domain-containing protein [bacterium]|nr:lytic transglycosylase domain-containing protein [bacterium]
MKILRSFTVSLLAVAVGSWLITGSIIADLQKSVLQKDKHISELKAELEAELKNKEEMSRADRANKIKKSTEWIMHHSSRISVETATEIAEEVCKYPNPILLLALIEVESGFVPSAVSKAGALGLGQVMFDIHKKMLVDLGIVDRRDLFNVKKNIKASSAILQMYLKKNKGDVVKALHNYLGGKDGKYVSKIFSNYVYLSLEINNEVPNL